MKAKNNRGQATLTKPKQKILLVRKNPYPALGSDRWRGNKMEFAEFHGFTES
jgi:hypothetical protein